MEQIVTASAHQNARLFRYGIVAMALGAWVAFAPAQGTAWADAPDAGATSTSTSTDAGPSTDADKPEADDKTTENDSTEPDETDDAADPDPEAGDPVAPEPPAETEEQPEPTDTIVDEPDSVEPAVQHRDSITKRDDPPKQETQREVLEISPLEVRTENEEVSAPVATLTPRTTLRTLDVPTPAPTRTDTATTALAAAATTTTVETTPTPPQPQPLSPIAELLEAPGRLVNAVLQAFGFTASANSPDSPIDFAPINDLVFGTFRELERQLGLWRTPAPQPVVPTMTYTGDTTRPTPTVAQFLNASAAGYVLGSTPGGLVPLTVDGFQMSSTNVFTGMVGKAWVTPEGQVIIAYQGTTGGTNLLFNPLITISQLVADLQVVFTGTTPLAFYDALDFAEQVQAEAALQGYGSDDIFVTGHSLGGWEAQFVAQRTGLAGIGFEAPGINTIVPGNGADSMFVNIGNYGSPASYLATDLPGLQPFMPPYVPGGGTKPHYGPIVMIGDPAAMTPLYNASTLWGTSPIGSLIFLVDFLGNFFQYHLPGVQAYHLGVTPDPGVVLWLGTSRGPVHTGYGELTIPELLEAASDDGILFQP